MSSIDHNHQAPLRMRQDEGVKSRIITEWQKWAEGKGTLTNREAMQFFEHLQHNQPELISNLGRGRKWQQVCRYLSSSGLLQ